MVNRLGAAVLLAAVLAAAFAPVVFGGRTLSTASWLPGVLPTGPVSQELRPVGPPPVRDVEGAAWVDEPAPYLVHRQIARGGLPLWNEAEGLGIPLLGNPNTGALSPLQLLVNLAPSPAVQDLAWLLRPLLLGFFTFALARELGVRLLGSGAAAVALMLSGQTVLWIEHHPLNTDVFVPAALWAALAVRRVGRPAIPWLALAVGAGLLGVKPQSAIMAAAFGAAILLADGWDRRRAKNAAALLPSRQLVALVLGVGLGFGLGAVALFPFWETYGGASGLVQAGRSSQSDWTLPLEALSSLGGTAARRLQALPLGAEALELPPGLPYAGLAVIAGAAFGAWATWSSWLTRILAATVILELLRIHGALPIPLAGVPILGSINYVKYCFPLYLALGLLLARGVDHLPAAGASAAVALVVAELIWLVPGGWAERVDLYAPAPWVEALRARVAERPGRLSGPVDVAPPLVSAAVGFRDLRSIDVLTPRDTYDFVTRLVSPSQGVTWILADPDPLLAATGPGANVADLRWITSTEPLDAKRLPAAVRASTTSRRLTRLFSTMTTQRIDTAELGGGIHDEGGDRRFHWTCRTPCRFEFTFAALPDSFAAGLASLEPAILNVRLGAEGEAPTDLRVPSSRVWEDIWFQSRQSGRPGSIVLEIESDVETPVFVGGIGPAPPPADEAREEERELSFRSDAFARLRLRWNDQEVYLYENEGALGEAFFAEQVVSVPDRDGALRCVAEFPGEPVACVPDETLRELPPFAPAAAPPELVRSEPSRVLVRTDAPEEGVLVVSRLAAPGWKASIDGLRVPVLRVNGALMGLVIPAGTHEVDLVYSPAAFWAGLALSLFSGLVVLGLFVAFRHPRDPV